MPESFYEILDVPRDADEGTITDAYRALVKEVHPDVSDRPDAAERFKLVQRAEEVLTDETERSRYDRMGHDRYVRLNGNPELHDFEDGSEGSGRDDSRSDIRDAAARAAGGRAEPSSDSTESSGPTNAGATAGWRERERRWRRTTDSPDWDIGADETGGFGERTDPFDGRQEFFGDRDDPAAGSEDTFTAGGSTSRTDPFDARTNDNGATGSGRTHGQSTSTGHGPNPWADATGDGSSTGTTGVDASGESSSDGGGTDRRRASATDSRSDSGRPTGQSRYAVNDWEQGTEHRSVIRTDWSQESAGFFVGTFLMYPLMLGTSVYPGFPFEVNLVISACTLFMAGYLLTRPGISAIVFGAWGLLLPVVIVWSGYPFVSLFGLIALIGTWIPFAYALAIGVVLSETL